MKPRLTAQQIALLTALEESSPMTGTELYKVRVREGDMFPESRTPDHLYRIGEPANGAMRRMEKRGFVTGERDGNAKLWSITDAGRQALPVARVFLAAKLAALAA